MSMTRVEKNLVKVLGVIREAATAGGVDLNEIEVMLKGHILRIECKLHAGYTLHTSLADRTFGRDELRLMGMSFASFLRGPRCPQK